MSMHPPHSSAIPDPAYDAETRQLEQTWASPPGFFAWFTHVNQTNIGMRFIVTGFVFFLLGVILALLMRWQLAVPENTVMGPELYNQIFSMHGITMMFLFAIPVMEGVAVYIIPLMLGTRDMTFPSSMPLVTGST